MMNLYHIYRCHFQTTTTTTPTLVHCDYGSGSLGALTVSASETKVLDTALYESGFQYTSVIVEAGGILSAVGPNPLLIYASVGINISGLLDISGGRGGNAGNILSRSLMRLAYGSGVCAESIVS